MLATRPCPSPDPWIDGCKILDTRLDAPLTAVPGFSTMISVNQIPQGKADSERIGREVTVRRLSSRFWITGDVTSTGAVYARMVIFRDRQFAGVSVSPAVLLQSNLITAHQNRFNRDRFEILYDETFLMDAVNHITATDYLHLQTPLQACVLDMDLTLFFSSASALSVRGNNIGVVWVVQASSNNTYFHGDFRLFYTDF